MRIVGPPLIGAALLVGVMAPPHAGNVAATAASTATAATVTATSDQAATAYGTWVTATERLKLAGSFLGQTFDLPDLTRRLSAYFDVQLRHAFAAGDRWFATLADRVAPSLAVPDLTMLRTEPVKGIESSGYGWREDPIDGGSRFHKGTDYRADRGTPVYAAGDGVVVFSGRQRGYGNVIYVDHGGGLITRYAHLNARDVARGDLVVADTLIGEVGATGRATGPHLHFEVRIDGRAVDPTLAMTIGEMQRTQPTDLARLAGMALLPEAQVRKVDRHGPPKHRNRPERRGRTRRDLPAV